MKFLRVLHFFRRVIPKPIVNAYHRALAFVATRLYGNPSARLIVIGVTGTYGKSSVVMLLGQVLRATGHSVGWMSTATISDGEREWLNAMKMTMPGRFYLQRFLRRLMVNGCTHAIVETSSQGIAQHRHHGIAYDVAVLTNLSPEHLEAHGGFEQYRAAKAKLFAHAAYGQKARRVAIVPIDLERPEEFTAYPFTSVRTFRSEDAQGLALAAPLAAFPANTACVLAVCDVLHVKHEAAAQALASIRGLPGRLERIAVGQPFEVIVDYAFTPDAIKAVYRAIGPARGRTVHVLGGTGGGRDRWKLPLLGEVAARHADIVIVTNEDPYDDDPQRIIAEVARGARRWYAEHDGAGVVLTILDRRDAIAQAIARAQASDRVLVTGKGCEQAIVGPRGAKVLWDDRVVLRELLRSYAPHQTFQSPSG